jgi:hypothetical protein
MSKTIRLTLLAFVSVWVAGCGLIGGTRNEQGPMAGNQVTLHVINQNYYDARLFARWRNGRRVSIGQVTGFDEESFTFRWEYFDLQVEINLLSVGVHYTPWMNVDRGDELELVIDPSLDKSIRIRRR